jgi:capsular polysaccharide biosynthesis protein
MLQQDPQHSTELGAYVAVVRRHWPLLLAGTAVALAGALLYVALVAPVYDATASLLVVDATTGRAVESSGAARNRLLLESPALARRVIDELQLGGVVPGITPARFASDVVRVDEVRGASILRLTARLPDPELSARAANRLAELASASIRSGAESAPAASSASLVERQLAEVFKEIEAVEQALREREREGAQSAERPGGRAGPAADALGGSRSESADRKTSDRLEIEHSVLGSIYADLFKRYHEERLVHVASRFELRLVDSAHPPLSPAFPSPRRVVAIAAFAGLVLSIIAAFVLDASKGTRGGPRAQADLSPGRHGGVEPRARRDRDVLVEVDRRDGV